MSPVFSNLVTFQVQEQLVLDFVMDALGREDLASIIVTSFCLVVKMATFVSSRHNIAIFTLINLIIFAIRKFCVYVENVCL